MQKNWFFRKLIQNRSSLQRSLIRSDSVITCRFKSRCATAFRMSQRCRKEKGCARLLLFKRIGEVSVLSALNENALPFLSVDLQDLYVSIWLMPTCLFSLWGWRECTQLFHLGLWNTRNWLRGICAARGWLRTVRRMASAWKLDMDARVQRSAVLLLLLSLVAARHSLF